MNAKDIAKRELIGLTAEITNSKNKSNIGIKGTIVDETKETIVIDARKGRKRLFKNNIMLNIRLPKQIISVKGEMLFGRPKERIKK